MYYAYSSQLCLQVFTQRPKFTSDELGCALLNEAGMLFLLAFLKVSICALTYILKLVSRNRGPKANML